MKNIITPIGRMSWVELPADDGKYKATLMLPKNAKALESLGLNPKQEKDMLTQTNTFVKKLRNTAHKMCLAKFGENLSEDCRDNPVIDGDETKWEGNHNFYLIRTKTNYAPKISHAKKSDGLIALDDTDSINGFYSGCWARIFISLYTYNVSGHKGTSFGLGSIQKAYNDEEFVSGAEFDSDIVELTDTDADFGDVEDVIEKAPKKVRKSKKVTMVDAAKESGIVTDEDEDKDAFDMEF